MWFSIRVEGEKNFRFAFPVPLFLLLLVGDLLEEASGAALLFGGKGRAGQEGKSFSPALFASLAGAAAALLREAALHMPADDFVDVDITDAQDNRVRIKLLTR